MNALVTLKDAYRIEPANGAVAELYDSYQSELQQDLETSQE